MHQLDVYHAPPRGIILKRTFVVVIFGFGVPAGIIGIWVFDNLTKPYNTWPLNNAHFPQITNDFRISTLPNNAKSWPLLCNQC